MPLRCWLFLLTGVTKTVIESMLPLGGSIAILPGLNIVYIENAGAAFGFLSSAGGWQRWFFITIGFMMIVLLLVLVAAGV